MANRRRFDLASLLTAAPAVFIVVIACAMPLLWMLAAIVANPDVRSELHLGSFRAHLLGRTLGYNGTAAVLATGMGLPAALVLGRGRGWLARVLWVVLPAALLMPSLSYAYGWSQFVRLSRPFLRWLWMFTAAHFGPEHAIHITFIPGGTADTLRCIWSLAAWLWAVPAGLIGLSLRRLDTNVQQAAVLDGALYRITFRQLVGPIIASLAVVTVLATQEFAVYEPTGISVVATEVRMVFDTGAVSSPDNNIAAPGFLQGGKLSPDQPARAAAAVVTALPLVICTVVLAIVAAWGAGRASASDALNADLWPRVLDAPSWASITAVALVVLNVGLPVFALVRSLRVPFSLSRMYTEFGPQVQGAIIVASIAATVAMIAAFSSAGRWTPGLIALAAASFLIGGQLLAIALIRIYNRDFLWMYDWAYNAFPVPVIAYVGRFGWLALAAGRGTWSRPWRELRDMASVDGADALRSAVSVVWPLAWPMLAAGGLLVGALSLTEVPATVLLFPQNPQVLTPTLMTWVHMARFDPMIEASLLMMISVLLPAALALGLLWVGLHARWRLAAKTAGFLVAAVLIAGCSRGGTPQHIWGSTGTGPGQFVYPRGIAYDKLDDTFFVVDRMSHLQHFDRAFTPMAQWWMPEKRLGKPVGLSVGPDGNVYVPDTHYQRIIVYTPDGKELRRWGGAGTDDGQFIYPTDVEFDSHGHVFVSEYGDNDRIQVFTPEGKFLYKFGRFGQGDGEFSRPQDMVIVGDTIYLTDACNHRIDVFKTDGTWVRNFGTCGGGLGQFRFPYGLDIDHKGRLVVSEFGNNRIQLVDKETGQGLKTWGVAGREPGQVAYPWGVIVDKSDRVIAVDAGNNRLQVFEF